MTAPITDEEVTSAAEMEAATPITVTSTGNMAVRVGPQPEIVNRSRSNSVVEEGEGLPEEDDQLTK